MGGFEVGTHTKLDGDTFGFFHGSEALKTTDSVVKNFLENVKLL